MSNAGDILIVDDSEESLKLLAGILTSDGYHVRPADSGELALATATMRPPEVILLDMRMPGMSGLDVCRQLKSRPVFRDIPVIFLSASLDFEDRLEGLESGAVDFINKPFRREELLARLKTHLELARLRKDLEKRVAERTGELQVANERLQSQIEALWTTQGELRESERRFRSIADTVPVGIWMSDRQTRITYASQWVLTFSGRTMEEAAGDGLLELFHPDDLDRILAERAAIVERQGPFELEYRLRRCDGEYRSVVSQGIPRFVQGEFTGYIGSMIDITELKRSQEYALASQKLESLGVLAAGIAHDFGNLLSTILAHSDLALQEIRHEPAASDHVSSIARVAMRAAEIVKLLMAYADQRDSGVSEAVELPSLIEEMVQLLQASVPRTTTLEVQLAEDLPPIWANGAQLRQVILNLIVNGSEALEGRAGAVKVVVSRVRISQGQSDSNPGGLDAGDYVLIAVSDTGCGMTEGIKAKIFDPFFSTKFLGRGLGLSAVMGIVRRAGGAIHVVSAPGQGSTFQVWLPTSDLKVMLQRTERAPAVASNQTGTVLLVDDEDALRMAVSGALKQEGFSVLEARDGLAAVQLFARNSSAIDIAVLDLTLPGLSGYDVCDEIRRLKPDLRVVITSAREPGARDEAAGHDAERHLQKPYRLRELIQTIREVLASPVTQSDKAS